MPQCKGRLPTAPLHGLEGALSPPPAGGSTSARLAMTSLADPDEYGIDQTSEAENRRRAVFVPMPDGAPRRSHGTFVRSMPPAEDPCRRWSASRPSRSNPSRRTVEQAPAARRDGQGAPRRLLVESRWRCRLSLCRAFADPGDRSRCRCNRKVGDVSGSSMDERHRCTFTASTRRTSESSVQWGVIQRDAQTGSGPRHGARQAQNAIAAPR